MANAAVAYIVCAGFVWMIAMAMLEAVRDALNHAFAWVAGLPWTGKSVLAFLLLATIFAVPLWRVWRDRAAILGKFANVLRKTHASAKSTLACSATTLREAARHRDVEPGFLLYSTLAYGLFLLIAFALVIDFGRIALEYLRGDSLLLTELANASNSMRGVWFMLLGLVGALAIPLAIHRARIQERQTRVQEKGHVTDRIIRATELLGATREMTQGENKHTEAAVEVRLGAIYTLERVAQESVEGGGDGAEHWPIIETMLAYIRQRRPQSEDWKRFPNVTAPFRAGFREEHGLREDAENTTNWDRDFAKAKTAWIKSGGLRKALALLPKPSEDVAAAISVLRRRTEMQLVHELGFHPDARSHAENPRKREQPRYAFELETTPLHRADLRQVLWKHHFLSGARLQGADLRRAHLEWSDLGSARLEGARLREAQLEGVRLSMAHLEGADLSEVRLERANLRWAHLEGANLNGALLDYADLGWSRLDGANLDSASLRGSDLSGAHLENADLGSARLDGADLSGANLEGASIIGATLCPDADELETNARAHHTVDQGERHLNSAKGLKQSQINAAFGDARTAAQVTKLGLDPPKHWANEDLDDFADFAAWKAWRNERGFD